EKLALEMCIVGGVDNGCLHPGGFILRHILQFTQYPSVSCHRGVVQRQQLRKNRGMVRLWYLTGAVELCRDEVGRDRYYRQCLNKGKELGSRRATSKTGRDK